MPLSGSRPFALFALLLAVLVTPVAYAPGSPQDKDKVDPDHVAKMAKGTELFKASVRGVLQAKCAKCHEFYDPKKYSEEDWRKWMGKMNKKSKLKREQADLLGRYLDSYRAGRIEGKAEGEAKPARKGKGKATENG